jgi:hypothetical protein
MRKRPNNTKKETQGMIAGAIIAMALVAAVAALINEIIQQVFN